MGAEYVLSWQITAAVFVIVMLVVWFLGGLLKIPRLVAFLVAAGTAVAVKYYWWWIDAKITAWVKFMGLDV